jgi:hypothetical protein
MLNTPRNKYAPPLKTEKKSLKKEFSLQPEAFPTLHINTTSSKQPALSFAQAAQTGPVKKPVTTTTEFLPGWLYIRQKQGKIEYKSGPSVPERYPCLEQEEEADNRLGRLLVKYRLAKEEYERNNDILRLGDLSEFYNTKTLTEQFEEEEVAMLKVEYLSSDSSDTEHF